MPRSTASGGHLVFESSSLIELERRKQLQRLTKLGHRVVIPPRVARDINKAPRSNTLRQWLEKHNSLVTEFATDAERNVYANLLVQRKELGDGEDSAIAIACSRGWELVVEDKAARRVAEELGVSCLSVKDLFPPPPLQERFEI